MKSNLILLLVEDNEGDIEMTEHALADVADCHLFVTHDGVEALDFLYRRGKFLDAPTPNLILLDLNMPRMDGKKLLEALKSDAALKTVPVVMFTSSQSPADIRECYQRQASCYVVKPFDVAKFADTVRQIVGFWGKLGRVPNG